MTAYHKPKRDILKYRVKNKTWTNFRSGPNVLKLAHALSAEWDKASWNPVGYQHSATSATGRMPLQTSKRFPHPFLSRQKSASSFVAVLPACIPPEFRYIFCTAFFRRRCPSLFVFYLLQRTRYLPSFSKQELPLKLHEPSRGHPNEQRHGNDF